MLERFAAKVEKEGRGGKSIRAKPVMISKIIDQ
jgi:hypothetical protein